MDFDIIEKLSDEDILMLFENDVLNNGIYLSGCDCSVNGRIEWFGYGGYGDCYRLIFSDRVVYSNDCRYWCGTKGGTMSSFDNKAFCSRYNQNFIVCYECPH